MPRVVLNCTVTEATKATLEVLAGGEKPLGRVVDELADRVGNTHTEELLDLVRSLPDAEDIKLIVDEALRTVIEERAKARTTAPAFDPASVAGVQRGVHRETSTERAQREESERAARVAQLDTSAEDRDDIDRSGEYVSG